MRRRFDAMCSLLATGLVAAAVAGCSKSDAPRDAANAQSLADLKAKDARGDAGSQVMLGFKYLEGQGVATNIDEGLGWIARGISQMEEIVASTAARTNARFEEVARQVDINICACRLGDYYALGQFVPQDAAKAIYWYQKAKDAPHAQFQIGFVHLTQTKNYPEAAKWLTQAAEAGHVAAQENLAGLYYHGQGVAQDYAAALKWFRLAAQAGEAPAQRMVGVFYQNGYGVLQDYAETAKWFRKAAEQGDAPSQSGLAFLYLNGLGVPKDYVEGYKWASLAAGQGDDGSRKNCNAASRLMTADQVKEAQRLASGFVARKDNGMPQQSGALPDSPIAKYGGTGFFITEDGDVLTSAHVVENAVRIEIFAAGKALAARLVKADVANDIALLKVDTSCKALALSASRGVNLGDPVFTIGFPGTVLQGTAPKLTQGEVTSLVGILDEPRHFQTSLAVLPGNSGGPLLDRCGNVIGIVAARLGDIAAFKTAGVLPQNVSYALKRSFVTALLETLPEISAKLKSPQRSKDRPLEGVSDEARQSIVLVTVY
jgi:uncharacterized protein